MTARSPVGGRTARLAGRRSECGVLDQLVDAVRAGESRTLLQFLFRHLITPAFLFRHHWSVDDLIVWDERSTVHLAPTDFHPHERRLVRVTAGQVAPTAPAAEREAALVG